MVLFNDLGWLFFIMTCMFNFVQFICLALAIFSDRRETPVFPRWSAYLSLWVALLLVPGALAVFFKHGPFARNGLLAFWVPFPAFFIWMIAMFVVVLRAIRSEELKLASKSHH